MVWILIIISVCTSLTEGLVIKKYNMHHAKGGFILTALISLFSMMFFLLTDGNGFSAPMEMYPYAIVSAILYSAASFLTFVALGCGSFAMSMLILSYSLVFSIGYGLFFLKEETTIYTYIGLLIILVSLYLVREKNDDAEKVFSMKWLICISLSAIGSGMFGVISRMQQFHFENKCNNEFMVVSLALSVIILFVLGVIKDRKDIKTILKNGSLYAICAGVSNGATNMLSMVINSLIAVSLAAPMSAGVKIILSFLLSKYFFKENFLKRQVIGVGLGAVALVFLNL